MTPNEYSQRKAECEAQGHQWKLWRCTHLLLYVCGNCGASKPFVEGTPAPVAG